MIPHRIGIAIQDAICEAAPSVSALSWMQRERGTF